MKTSSKDRTKAFALSVITLIRTLPRNLEGQMIGRQLFRSATSVAANYRATQRAKSKADFIAKLAIVEEEADECCFWMEMINHLQLLDSQYVNPVLKEANEITAMVVVASKTAKANRSHATRTGMDDSGA